MTNESNRDEVLRSLADELEDELRRVVMDVIEGWAARHLENVPGQPEFVGKIRGSIHIAGTTLIDVGMYVSFPPGKVMVPPPA
jgi:hypothetical protein